MSIFDKFFIDKSKLEVQQKNNAMTVIQSATHHKLSISEYERVYDAIASNAMSLNSDDARIREGMSIINDMKADWLTKEEKENFVAGVWLCECGKDSNNNSGITYINQEELQYTRKAILGTAFKQSNNI